VLVGRQPIECLSGFFHLPHLSFELGVGEYGARVGRVDLQCLGDQRGGCRGVAPGDEPIRLGQQGVRFPGNVTLEERPNLGLGQRAHELIDGRAPLENLDRGKAADAEAGGEIPFLFGVYFRDSKLTPVFLGELGEHRHQHAAGCAPLRPEIDYDRVLVGGLQNNSGEVFPCRDNDVTSFGHALECPPHRSVRGNLTQPPLRGDPEGEASLEKGDRSSR